MRNRFVFLAMTVATFCCIFGISEGATGDKSGSLDLGKVFAGSPIIYLLLSALSLSSLAVWIYSLMTLRIDDMMPTTFLSEIRDLVTKRRYEAALSLCQQDNNFSSSIIASGISARKHGPQVMMEAMQSEGRRAGMTLWQRISFLNEVAVVAPMLGLLGTVIGLFFAFYDTSRTAESIALVFDGLGIAVGTTVAGLIVAIIAMIFYTTLKFRLVSLLNLVENEVQSLVTLVDLEQPAKPAPVEVNQ